MSARRRSRSRTGRSDQGDGGRSTTADRGQPRQAGGKGKSGGPDRSQQQGGGRASGGGRKRSSGRKNRNRRQQAGGGSGVGGGAGFWGDPSKLPISHADVKITDDPAAVPRSLGAPPLPGHEAIAVHYFTAVYDRAVATAGALAAAGGLIDPDALVEESDDS